MKDRTIYIIVGVFIALSCIGAVVWFQHTYERVEVDVDLGMEPEALRNPYLGLERYFEALDIEVESSARWQGPEELEGKDVIIVDLSVVLYSSWARHHLVPWTNNGGHLILLEPGLESSEDFEAQSATRREFFASLQLDWEWSRCEDLEEITVSYEVTSWSYSSGSSDLDSSDSECQVTLPKGTDYLAVASTHKVPIVTSGSQGQGRVTVVPDRWTVTTESLREPEAGQMWADVLALQSVWPEEMLFSPKREGQGWLARVWERGWPTFIGLLLLFLLGLTRARRFGPAIAEPDRRRRRRAEHIEATGRFLWHRSGSDVLIRATRRALLEAMARRRPSILALKPEQKYRLMAEELQVDEEVIKQLMTSSEIVQRPEEFRYLIARLEELRRNL